MQYTRARRWLTRANRSAGAVRAASVPVRIGIFIAVIAVTSSAAGVDSASRLEGPTTLAPTPTATFGPMAVAPASMPTPMPTPAFVPSITPSTNPPTPTPTPPSPANFTPVPTAQAPSSAPVGAGPCGPIPGEPTGWTRKVHSTFSESTTLGNWPGPVAARAWRSRPAGYSDSSGRGTYNSDKTVTEHDGLLDIYVHSEGSTRYIAAPIALLGDTYGQRISLCMRADSIPGYKLAFLLWPGNGSGNDQGEIDYPEGKLTSKGVANAFMHYDPKPAGDPNKDAYSTGTSTANWHVYTIEWNPGSQSNQLDDYAAFYLDGREIGRSSGSLVPDGPMHYIAQIETYLAGQPLPPPAAGHILVDWATISTPG